MTISYRVRKQIVDYFAQRKSSQEIEIGRAHV